MFRYRFRLWGLDKNRKESEMRAIVCIHDRRQKDGKTTLFWVRNERAHYRTIEDYFKRKGISIEEILAEQPPPPTPSTISYQTPPPSPVMTPNHLKVPEDFLRMTRQYMQGLFESKTWRSCGDRCITIKDPEYEKTFSLTDNFSGDLKATIELLSKGRRNEAIPLLRRTTSWIGDMVAKEIPRALDHLLFAVVKARKHNHPEILKIILDHFLDFAELHYDKNHSLYRICRSLIALVREHFEDIQIYLNAWQSIIDCFDAYLNKYSITTTYTRLVYHDEAGDKTTWNQALQKLSAGDDAMSAKTQNLYLIGLASAYFRNEDYASCLETTKRLDNSTSHLRTPEWCAEETYRRYVSAFALRKLQENRAAENELRGCIDMRDSILGSGTGKSVALLSILEGWLEESGKHEAALETMRERSAVIEYIDKICP